MDATAEYRPIGPLGQGCQISNVVADRVVEIGDRLAARLAPEPNSDT
jgi:hypothetical protein